MCADATMGSVDYAIIEAPSVLGLFPRGVEGLPAALLDAGLAHLVGGGTPAA